jgi:isoquinoline 1-oxidoreductase beta subunit
MGHIDLSRRAILKTGLLGGGLMLGLRLPGLALGADGPDFMPNAFIKIDPAGAITLIMPNAEVGQGIHTAAAMLIAEELEVGLDQVKLEAAPPDEAKYSDPLLGEQATGGSSSIRGDWVRLREAGAVARTMLIAAAARQWKTDPATCQAQHGAVLHKPTGRSLPYGALVAVAATLPVPEMAKTKQPSEFNLIGTPAKRLDTPLKVNGTAIYGIDAKAPGMKIGTLAICPVKGGRIMSMNETSARSIPGVQAVLKLEDGSAVAVVGDHMWAAKQGLDQLAVRWNSGANGGVTSKAIVDALGTASRDGKAIEGRKKGDAQAAISGAATKLSAIYELPFLSHAPMEPVNCLIHVRPDGADVWTGTQVPVRARNAVAKATGLKPESITINNHSCGSAFGRRLDIDMVEITAGFAKQVPYPLKMIWTREEDTQHDYYRPYYYDRVEAGLDAGGKLVGWTQRTAASSVMARWAPAGLEKNGLDPDTVEAAVGETPYDVPAEHSEFVRCEAEGISTGWWRGVGPTHNVFVVESFVDELATAAKQDPVTFRRALLQSNPRALAVLNLAAEKGNWGAPLPAGHGRGVQVQYAFETYLATVLEVEITPQGEILPRRVVVAVDCGSVVNPNTVEAQIQGGMILGLGTALYNEITLANGRVEQSNFHDYRTLRMNEAPRIEVFQIRNNEKPGGIGETGTAAAASALGNAIFAATGRRLRRLPFGNQLQSS